MIKFHAKIKDKYLLTIAIPTYNRAETLEKIIIQLDMENNKSFLILISDNNSSDNTKKMVNKYQKLMPNLIYSRNKVNLGYSGNICKLYELTSTRYMWFLCDDDSVLPGAISKIEKAINKYKPRVAIFNCTWIDSYGRNGLAGVNHDIIYQNFDELTNYQTLMRTTYLSALVLEKKIPINKLKKQNYRDNVFFQISLSLLLLSNKFRLCEVSETIVHRNVGYKYGEFFKFCLVDSLKAVHIIDNQFDNKKFIKWSKSILFLNLQLYLSQKIGLFRYEQKMSPKTKKLIFQYYGYFYGLIIMSFPIIKFIIPTLLIKLLYLIRLLMIHGYETGVIVYKRNINRAFLDNRKTGFIN